MFWRLLLEELVAMLEQLAYTSATHADFRRVLDNDKL